MQNIFTFSAKAHAKVNLDLKVVSTLNNGYHTLESTFVKIPWLYDDITLKIFSSNKQHQNKLKTAEIICNIELDDKLNTHANKQHLIGKNITITTVEKFFDYLSFQNTQNIKNNANETKFQNVIKNEYGIEKIEIFIKKRIPIAAGLGGGSSDASTVMQLLNQYITTLALNELKALSYDEMLNVGLSVGADVPFFLSNYDMAIVTGIGENISPIYNTDIQNITDRLLIINPTIQLNTKEVFKCYDKRNTKHHTNNITKHSIKIQNDLYSTAVSLCPTIKEIIDCLNNIDNIETLGMSGSGATCFAIFNNRESLSNGFQKLTLLFSTNTNPDLQKVDLRSLET